MRQRLWILLLAAFLLIGCRGAEAGENEDAMLEDELIRIDEESCTLAEAMIFVAAQKNIYQDSYGGDIWSVQLESGTFETYIMNGLKSYLGKLFTAAEMAKAEGRELTEDEAAKADAAASAYMAAMSAEETAATHLSQEIVRDAYGQYILALKLYDDVMEDANVEVSDDEARVIHIQRIFISSEDKDRQSAKEKAVTAMAELEAGADFAAVSGKYNETGESLLEVARGELPESQEKAAFALGTGDRSDIVDTGNGFAIFYCRNAYDETASNANKAKILAARKDQVFADYLNAFIEAHQVLFNDSAWEKLSISGYSGAASANFYTIYQEFFTEQ